MCFVLVKVSESPILVEQRDTFEEGVKRMTFLILGVVVFADSSRVLFFIGGRHFLR
jgi:hypothetical protein